MHLTPANGIGSLRSINVIAAQVILNVGCKKMKKKIDIIAKLHLVEALLIFGIIAIPASLVLRVIYARQMIEWENNFAESIGIPSELWRLFWGVIAISVFVTIAVRQNKKRKKQKQAGYQLPES